MSEQADFVGRVAIITGAADAKGQGAATARELSARGAAVVLCDVDEVEVEARAREIRETGGQAVAMRADVRDESQVKSLIMLAMSEYGRLDILHSQAADLRLLAEPGDPDITQVTVALWREQFETIVLGSMLACKYAIPAMLQSGGGSIICTTSMSGSMGEPNLTVYGSAKAAVNQLVRSVAAQWGKQGIRCNAVAPGLVLSQPGLDIGPDLIDQYERHCSTPTVGTPRDVALIVAFLASDSSRMINGEVIHADGGFTSHSPMLADQMAGGASVGGLR
jgi:NAD(P)-dependent dehydrogenase (short-subunit alcohol dehydrogenase family)